MGTIFLLYWFDLFKKVARHFPCPQNYVSQQLRREDRRKAGEAVPEELIDFLGQADEMG